MNYPVCLWFLVTALHIFGITYSLEQRYIQGAIKTTLNHKLNGHQIRTLNGSTLLSCAHSCLMDARCVSTNFGISSSEKKLLCELNDQGGSFMPGNELVYAEGFTYSAYSAVFQRSTDVKDKCDQIVCLNEGQCYYNTEKQKNQCKCILPWFGDVCEKKIDIEYHFTTLGATGKSGPVSNALYQGTSLEEILVKDGLQSWNIPLSATYRIELCGATGGNQGGLGTIAGRGAKVNGTIYLQQGTQLTVLVGQRGKGGGGGGGTFVVFTDSSTPLVVAGGGGAAVIIDGDPGQAGLSGSVNPGGKGKGGKVCMSGNYAELRGVGGGGGLLTDGRCFGASSCNKPCDKGDGGKSFQAGGKGGYTKTNKCAGGFGGGGSCGGGGGYSGGGVQVDGKSKNLDLHAGGGGSFFPTDANWTAVSGGCPDGDGYVLFKIVAID